MLSTLFKLDVEFYPGVTLEQFKEQDIVNDGTLDCDAIIIARDMLDISSYMNLSVQIVVMQKYLRNISETTPCWFVPGIMMAMKRMMQISTSHPGTGSS